MITLLLTLRANAKAAASILQYVEDLAKAEPGAVTVQNVDAEPVKKRTAPRGLPSGRTVADRREAHRQAPGTVTAENPFVAQAVASSLPMRARIAEPVRAAGRNRVVYMLVEPAPEGAVIYGVPRQVLDVLSTYPDGMSAKDVEHISKLKRKSIESALYSLRVQGVIQSVEV